METNGKASPVEGVVSRLGDEWRPAERNCPKCDNPTLEYRVVESYCGGYEDVNYFCRTCRNEWWVDGDDG